MRRDVRDALDDLRRLHRRIGVREDDVRYVGHHRRAETQWAWLDGREEPGAVVMLEERVAALLQRLELGVRELRAELPLA